MNLVTNILTTSVLTGLIMLGGCKKSQNHSSDGALTELVLGTHSGYPPYESVGATGEIEGFDIDVAQALAKKLGRKLVVKDMSFDALILALKQSKFDIIMGGMSITPSRQKEIAMIPYQGDPITSFALIFWDKIPETIKTMADIKSFGNKTVAVQTGTTMEDYLRKVPGVVAKPLESTPELIMDIKHQKSVAALLEPHIANDVLSKHLELKRIDVELPKEDWVLGNGIGIKKENTELINQVQKAIDELKKEGVIKQFEQKWLKGEPA